jgi:hypothetical protein
MKKTAFVVVALLAGGMVLASDITSSWSSNVYNDQQQPDEWFVCVDPNPLNRAFNFAVHGGPSFATLGTAGTYTQGVLPHVNQDPTSGTGTEAGAVTSFFTDLPIANGPGDDIEIWHTGSANWTINYSLHDVDSGWWVTEGWQDTDGDGTGDSGTGELPSNGKGAYFLDLSAVKAKLVAMGAPPFITLNTVDAVVMGGTGGWNGHYVNGTLVGPATVLDYDNDGTIDVEWNIGGGKSYQTRDWNVAGINYVPEPFSMLLVGGGLLALIRRRK